MLPQTLFNFNIFQSFDTLLYSNISYFNIPMVLVESGPIYLMERLASNSTIYSIVCPHTPKRKGCQGATVDGKNLAPSVRWFIPLLIFITNQPLHEMMEEILVNQLRGRSLKSHYSQGFSTIPGGFLAGFLNHQQYRQFSWGGDSLDQAKGLQ